MDETRATRNCDFFVALVGETPVGSSPLRSLRDALERKGVSAICSSNVEYRSTREWISIARQTDVIVAICHDGGNEFINRQLALAVVFGTPVIRWWIGTDVLEVIEKPASRDHAVAQQCYISHAVAVSEQLCQELQHLDIKAEYIPSLLGEETAIQPQFGCRPGWLVYLPTKRAEFYGLSSVRHCVENNPDIRFVIVADDEHILAKYPNVESLGWVNDMSTVWESVTGVLRITQHDGLPRMILEALRRGKKVVYSWRLDGCCYAKSPQEASDALRRLSELESPSQQSLAAYERFRAIDPEAHFLDVLRHYGTRISLMKRVHALKFIAWYYLRKKLAWGRRVRPIKSNAICSGSS